MYALIDKPDRKSGAYRIFAGKKLKLIGRSPRDDIAMAAFGVRFAV